MITREAKFFIPRFLIVLCLFILLDIMNTTLLPILGLSIRPPFFLILILYLAFFKEFSFIPLLVFIIHYSHSIFSIEGWAITTLSSLFLIVIIGQFREVIHLSNFIMAIFFLELFQIIWLALFSLFLFIKVGNIDFISHKISYVFYEITIVSLVAPLFFKFLNHFFNSQDGMSRMENR